MVVSEFNGDESQGKHPWQVTLKKEQLNPWVIF